MKDKILDFLKEYKKKTIPLIEIEKILSGSVKYIDFSRTMRELVEEGLLTPVKIHGTNNKKIPLANTYRINKSYFKQKFIDEIAIYQLKLDSSIDLQSYFSLGERQWKEDLPYIKKINSYLKINGLPKDKVTAPERSYEILGDEKWIDEKGGKELLKRIGLLGNLKIDSVPDPLMFAINKNRIFDESHIHLIVENKAPFYALLDDIENTIFTSLIYGAGWSVLGGISVYEKQLSLTEKTHKYYYFGDLDYEGISIWYGLNGKKDMKIATEFYNSLLEKDISHGKENQVPNREAIEKFLTNFNERNSKKIIGVLKKGGYYPQEGLSKKEIIAIWRNIR